MKKAHRALGPGGPSPGLSPWPWAVAPRGTLGPSGALRGSGSARALGPSGALPSPVKFSVAVWSFPWTRWSFPRPARPQLEFSMTGREALPENALKILPKTNRIQH